MHKKHQNQSVWVSWIYFGINMGWKLVGDRFLECVTVSYQTNCQPLEMYKEGAGKVERVVVCLCWVACHVCNTRALCALVSR